MGTISLLPRMERGASDGTSTESAGGTNFEFELGKKKKKKKKNVTPRACG
jgi:hypothetical protein